METNREPRRAAACPTAFRGGDVCTGVRSPWRRWRWACCCSRSWSPHRRIPGTSSKRRTRRRRRRTAGRPGPASKTARQRGTVLIRRPTARFFNTGRRPPAGRASRSTSIQHEPFTQRARKWDLRAPIIEPLDDRRSRRSGRPAARPDRQPGGDRVQVHAHRPDRGSSRTWDHPGLRARTRWSEKRSSPWSPTPTGRPRSAWFSQRASSSRRSPPSRRPRRSATSRSTTWCPRPANRRSSASSSA